MSETTQRCGFDLTYCEDCGRPDALRPFCQQFHRAMLDVRTIARSQPNADAYSALIELLTSQAVDLALEATKRPVAVLEIMRTLITSRINELHEAGCIRPIGPNEVPPAPPPENKTIH